jgi:hypothetical protein
MKTVFSLAALAIAAGILSGCCGSCEPNPCEPCCPAPVYRSPCCPAPAGDVVGPWGGAPAGGYMPSGGGYMPAPAPAPAAGPSACGGAAGCGGTR